MLQLAGPIDPDGCRHDAADNNMMVVLKKASEGEEWPALEAAGTKGGPVDVSEPVAATKPPAAAAAAPSQPPAAAAAASAASGGKQQLDKLEVVAFDGLEDGGGAIAVVLVDQIPNVLILWCLVLWCLVHRLLFVDSLLLIVILNKFKQVLDSCDDTLVAIMVVRAVYPLT